MVELADIKTTLNFRTKYRHNPMDFMVEVLDVKREYVWDKMVEVSESVRDNQFTAVKAGNSCSKSYIVGRLAIWFLYCFYPSTVITTAPSGTQVEEILWREIHAAYNNAKLPLGGHLLQTELDLQRDVKGEKWYAIGFSTKPDTATQQATRMQGFHNKYVLIIFDEGAGILKPIWEAKDKLITNPFHKFIAIGNPTMSKGDFVDCFKDSSYNKITISVKDTPNYKQNKEVIPGLSGRQFEANVIKKYGENSNHYKAMITGEIPSEDVDSFIPIDWIEKAEDRSADPHLSYIKRFVTVDVADGGDDDTVIKAWENKTEIKKIILRDKKVEDCEPYVWRLLREIKGNAIIYDHDGIGRVMGGFLRASADAGTTIIPFEGSSKEVYDSTMFMHRRSEGHWAMRKDFERNLISIMRDEFQKEEIANLKTVAHSRGFVAIEKKKDYKKRVGRSPNQSDAVMMMCAEFDRVPIIERQFGSQTYRQGQEQGSAMAA